MTEGITTKLVFMLTHEFRFRQFIEAKKIFDEEKSDLSETCLAGRVAPSSTCRKARSFESGCQYEKLPLTHTFTIDSSTKSVVDFIHIDSNRVQVDGSLNKLGCD